MTREEAANSIQLEIDRIEDNQAYEQMSKSMYEDGYRRIEALVIAMKALRSGWVRTSERVPTATDEVGGMVVTATRVPCFDGLGEIIEIRQAYAVIRGGETRYNYWMALPKLPNMEDEA